MLKQITEVFSSQYRLLELVETMALFLHDNGMFDDYEEEYGIDFSSKEREYLLPAEEDED